MEEHEFELSIHLVQPAHYVFFFQAEDGIRDVAVTGVQTCALPIFWRTTRRRCSGKSTRLWANQERTCSFRSPQTPRPSTDAWEVRVDFPNARSSRLAAASQKKPRRHGE